MLGIRRITMSKTNGTKEIPKDVQAFLALQRIVCPKRERMTFPRWLRSTLVSIFTAPYFDKEDFDRWFAKAFPNEPLNSAKYRWMLRDAMDCLVIYGLTSDNYFTGHCYEKNYAGRNDFITAGRMYRVYNAFNAEVHPIELFSKCGMYSVFQKFYRRDVLALESDADKPKFYAFLEEHGKGIIKPNLEYGGHGVRIITREEAQNAPGLFDRIVSENCGALIEEVLVQGKEMAHFNESSVNTVRIQMIVLHGKPEPLFCFVRYGKPGSLVDNISSGGSYVLVDPKCGITFSKTLNGTTDPITGKQVVGIQLPEWETMVQTAREVMLTIPQCHLLGMDFAYSEKYGWV